MKSLIAAPMLIGALTIDAHARGSESHRIVAEIAEQFLEPSRSDACNEFGGPRTRPSIRFAARFPRREGLATLPLIRSHAMLIRRRTIRVKEALDRVSNRPPEQIRTEDARCPLL